jgi:peroxiredoxin Q/BCP
MADLKVGQTAPKFSLKDKDGKAHSIGALKADYTVLYFYPKDDTPGCTLEAKEFSQSLPKFKSRNVQVVGVSGGNEKTKASFCKKYSLKIPLVSDTNFKVSKSYGAYGTKKFMGRSFQGIFRKTFLLDKSGKIARIFDSVKPEGHADEVLAVIDSLSKKAAPKKSLAPSKSAASQKKVASKKSAAAPKKRPAKKAVSKRTVKKVAKVSTSRKTAGKARRTR